MSASKGSFQQGLSLKRITFVALGNLNIQWQLGFGIDNQVDFVAEEGVVPAFSSPGGIVVVVAPCPLGRISTTDQAVDKRPVDIIKIILMGSLGLSLREAS